jgi:hypothetical protein
MKIVPTLQRRVVLCLFAVVLGLSGVDCGRVFRMHLGGAQSIGRRKHGSRLFVDFFSGCIAISNHLNQAIVSFFDLLK